MLNYKTKLKLKNSSVILFTLLCINNVAQSQTFTELRNSVKIPETEEIILYKTVTKIDTIPVGAIVKDEYIHKKGEHVYTITKIDTIDINETTKYSYEEKVKIKMGHLDGRATLKISDEKDIVYVNFWLNPKNKIKLNKTESELKYIIYKAKIINEKSDFKTAYLGNSYINLKKDTVVKLWKANLSDTTESWFQKSDEIIAVYRADTINAFYVNKYDRSGDYRLELKNRDSFHAYRSRMIIGAVTIPIKYRRGYSKDSITVKNDFSADANLGLYIGYSGSNYRVRYETQNFVELPEIGWNVGLFTSLSAVQLDSLSTSAGLSPLAKDDKATIGVLSSGLGLMFSINNISIGGFAGWDFGFGTDAKNWNFNNKFWFGFGLNYSISSFSKKE